MVSIDDLEIPDFEEMMELTDKIKKLSLKKAGLELKIEELEKETIVTMTENEEHYINGKPPSMSYLRDTYKKTGMEGEILKYRKKLAEVSSELDYYKNRLYIYKDMIDVWRTVSANKRASVV